MNAILNWLFENVGKQRSAVDWAERLQIQIIDPDGWRDSGHMGNLPLPPTSLEAELGLEEFLWRLSTSTIGPL